MGTHLRATERHLPYGIGFTQCYLASDTGGRVPPQSQPDWLVLDSHTLQGWKTKLTCSSNSSSSSRRR